MAKILLQTTIPFAEDNWHIGRFSLLRDHLAREHDVVARDRETSDRVDPVLAALPESDFDEVWLFAVDTGDGLHPEECHALSAFRAQGGGLFVTRDHMDLGVSVCDLGGIGKAHHFHSKNVDPEIAREGRDDRDTPTIDWPNFHSGSNGDVQEIEIVEPVHPLLVRNGGERLRYFPAHPHEGGVGAPPDDPTARVIARGTSTVTGRKFNIGVAFDSRSRAGNGLAESTFHHFADYNWDTSKGSPSFVSEPPSDRLREHPELLDDIKAYTSNIAGWLSRVEAFAQ